MTTLVRSADLGSKGMFSLLIGLAAGLYWWSWQGFDPAALGFGFFAFLFWILIGTLAGAALVTLEPLRSCRPVVLVLIAVAAALLGGNIVSSIHSHDLGQIRLSNSLDVYLGSLDDRSHEIRVRKRTADRTERYSTSLPVEEELEALEVRALSDGWVFDKAYTSEGFLPGSVVTGLADYTDHIRRYSRPSAFAHNRTETLILSVSDIADSATSRGCEIIQRVPITPPEMLNRVLGGLVALTLVIEVAWTIWKKRHGPDQLKD